MDENAWAGQCRPPAYDRSDRLLSEPIYLQQLNILNMELNMHDVMLLIMSSSKEAAEKHRLPFVVNPYPVIRQQRVRCTP